MTGQSGRSGGDNRGEPEATQRIAVLTLDETLGVRRSPEVEREREIAISDLIAENAFSPHQCEPGPYRLKLGLQENRLVLDIAHADDNRMVRTIQLSLTPFRRIIRDYFLVCESYYEALKTASPSRIEAIDMGRRGLHDEGSRLLQARLKGKITVDHKTARRLFTLLCALHIRG